MASDSPTWNSMNSTRAKKLSAVGGEDWKRQKVEKPKRV